MPPVSVLNRHHLKKGWWKASGYFYIGRGPNGSPLANPYLVQECGRENAIQEYRKELHLIIKTKGERSIRMNGPAAYEELVRLANLYRRGVPLNLVCSCKPQGCHGDVLAKAIPYLAHSLGLCVGDTVSLCDSDERATQEGEIIWIDDSLSFCDVVWESGASPRRYELSLLNICNSQNS